MRRSSLLTSMGSSCVVWYNRNYCEAQSGHQVMIGGVDRTAQHDYPFSSQRRSNVDKSITIKAYWSFDRLIRGITSKLLYKIDNAIATFCHTISQLRALNAASVLTRDFLSSSDRKLLISSTRSPDNPSQLRSFRWSHSSIITPISSPHPGHIWQYCCIEIFTTMVDAGSGASPLPRPHAAR